MKKPRWLLTNISLDHRVTVTIPMNILGVVEDLIGTLTFGFIQPHWSTHYGLTRARNIARRNAAAYALRDNLRIALEVSRWERLIERTGWAERWEFRDRGRWRKYWRRHGSLPRWVK